MPRAASPLLAAGLVAGASLTAVSCGGPSASGGCHYENWQGQCQLVAVRTARIVDRFPRSYAVLEATYEPVSRAGVFAPPPFRHELHVLAEQAAAAEGTLRSAPLVDCTVASPVGDPCAPRMSAAIPAFTPASVAPAATGPVGCQKIEQGGARAPVPAGLVFPGPVQFEPDSAALGADAERLVAEVAATLARDPKIECLALRARTAPGEAFVLANDRSQAVRRALTARGVDAARVTVFEATAPAHAVGPAAEQVDPTEQRRVHFTVVVYGAP
ncbi:MAG: hypothetical protein FJ104_05115 [Deltaproteobacteria bacterium]|nr:hypothetical protein [Deltaproteobacteria bacterium]